MEPRPVFSYQPPSPSRELRRCAVLVLLLLGASGNPGLVPRCTGRRLAGVPARKWWGGGSGPPHVTRAFLSAAEALLLDEPERLHPRIKVCYPDDMLTGAVFSTTVHGLGLPRERWPSLAETSVKRYGS